MNGALAVIIAAVMCIICIVAWVIISDRLDPPQRDPFADPADIADPHGDQYIEQITTLRDFPEYDEDDPAIDNTGQLPAAVCTWGKTPAELADELAAKYLTAEVAP